MGFYRIADRVFELRNRYNYTERLCADYKTDETKADFTIELKDSEINAEDVDDAAKFPPAYLESLAFYRKIAEYLIDDDCILFHASVLTFDGKAYAFTAKSGTGKSTHTALWKKVYGDRVCIINGDKPILRRVNENGKDRFIVYGTPWCGKEHKNVNTSAELYGICILERSEKNFIERMGQETVEKLLGQIFVKKDAKYMFNMLGILDSLVTEIPIYRLGCNMNDDAAVVACRALTQIDT